MNVILESVRFVNWPILFGGYLPIVAAVAVAKLVEPFAYRYIGFDYAQFAIGILSLSYCIVVGVLLTRQTPASQTSTPNQWALQLLIIISTAACTVHLAFAYVASWFERTDPVFSWFVCLAFAVPAIALVATTSFARAHKMHVVGWILALDFAYPCIMSARALIFLLNNHCTVLWPQNILFFASPIVLFNLACLGISALASMISKWPQSALGLLVTLALAALAFTYTGRTMAILLDISASPCRLFLRAW